MKKTLSVLLTVLLLAGMVLPVLAAGSDDRVYVEIVEEPERCASIEAPEGYTETVDWDGLFETIKTAIVYRAGYVDIGGYGVPANEANRDYIKDYLFNEPSLLGMMGTLSITVNSANKYVGLNLAGSYRFTAQEFNEMTAVCEDVMTQMLYGIQGNDALTDAEKCLLLHDRLADWSAYDYDNYIAGTIPDVSYSAYGPLGLHVGVCEGYAMAYGWMLDKLGFVNYYTRSASLGHGWNMVYIDDDEPYYIDVTWDDPGTGAMEGKVYHDNFLQSFTAFSAGHRDKTDFSDLPSSTRYENEYWVPVECAIQYLNGNMYYFAECSDIPGARYALYCRDHAGEVTVVKSFNDRWYTPGGGYYIGCFARMTSIGNKLFYSTPKEVYSYDVVTGEDALLYAPDFTAYEEGSNIYGLTQRDGTIQIIISTITNRTSETPGFVETLAYCTDHTDRETLKTISAPNCTNEGSYKYICKDCRALGTGTLPVDPEAHEPDGWNVVRSSTCSTPGYKWSVCIYCEMPMEEEIPVDPIMHEVHEERGRIEPSCVSTGHAPGVFCTACNRYITGGEPLSDAPAGHRPGEWTTVRSSTCTVPGEKQAICQVCLETVTEALPLDPAVHVHTEERDAVTATCVTEGRDAGTFCTDCRTYVSGGTPHDVDPTNHVNTEEKAAVTATCITEGRDAGTYCNDCKKFVSGGTGRGLNATNHVNTEEKAAVAASCTAQGREAGVYCNDCKKFVSGGGVIGKLPHDYVAVVTEPTCTRGGYTTHTCRNCPDSYTDSQTAALGHIDENGDQRCDRCNADLSPEANCSCSCHKGGIFGFFFKIKVFFWKLFGMEQYRYCDCGKAHW